MTEEEPKAQNENVDLDINLDIDRFNENYQPVRLYYKITRGNASGYLLFAIHLSGEQYHSKVCKPTYIQPLQADGHYIIPRSFLCFVLQCEQ